MSLKPNTFVTSLNSGASAYITRQEVIQAFSTIANDLSGATLFFNPNPQFSTITMNSSGTIGGGTLVGATSALQISSVLETYNRMFPVNSDPYTLGIRDNVGSNKYQPITLGQVWVKPNVYTTEPTTIVAPQLFAYATSLTDPTQQKTIIQYNASLSNVALSNISSINGNPPSGQTTFTSLTGSNITLSGMLTSPQIVSLSSINGAQYLPAYTSTYNGNFGVTIANSNATLIASITLPPGTLKPNMSYLFDVPIVFTSFTPGAPTGFTLNIGLRLGGNGQINYQYPLYVQTSAQGFPISLTGVAQTNSVSVTTQTIDIVGYQQSGSGFQCTFNAPTSAGGLNTYLLKSLI